MYFYGESNQNRRGMRDHYGVSDNYQYRDEENNSLNTTEEEILSYLSSSSKERTMRSKNVKSKYAPDSERVFNQVTDHYGNRRHREVDIDS